MKLLMFYQNVIPESPYYEFEANQYVTDKCQTVCTSLGYVPIFQQKGERSSVIPITRVEIGWSK
jgi:hypothetical protein